jgi:hypothetical protein
LDYKKDLFNGLGAETRSHTDGWTDMPSIEDVSIFYFVMKVSTNFRVVCAII